MHTNSTSEPAGPAALANDSVPITMDDRRTRASWSSALYEAKIECEFVEAGERSHVIVDFQGDEALIMKGTRFYLGCARVPFSITDPDSAPISGSFHVSRDATWGFLTLSGTLSDAPAGPQERFRLFGWTPDDPDRGNDPDWYKPLPGSVPTPVTTVTTPPACFVGKLEIVFQKDGSTLKFLGTGTLIQAEDASDNGLYVLTCAHNLFDPTYGKAHSVTFFPGFNGPGSAVGIKGKGFYPSDYPGVAIGRQQDRSQIAPELLEIHDKLDYGLVKLDKPVKLKLKQSRWPTMLSEDTLDGKGVTLTGLYGYGGDEDTMFQVTGKIVGEDGKELDYDASTEPGSSGTAVMLDPKSDTIEVVAVHVRAGLAREPFNVGIRLTPLVIADIVSWQKPG